MWKKIVFIVILLLAFIFGMMLFLYVAEPGGMTVMEEVQSAPSISASHAILTDGRTGEILYEKNARQKAYPASTTKIMTALVVLDICRENGISLQEQVTVPKEAVGTEGSSLHLKAGQKRTIEELLYGIMLQSGNDGAETLAICLGGNRENFIRRMNSTAQHLGCEGTRFNNPSGLFDENHYTTAADLAVIARKAMEQKEFRRIVGARSWGNYYNKNKTVHQYQGATGIKIGFTEKSGRTLVTSAADKDVELICVVLRDPNWFQDAYALMDYGFALKGVKEDEE